MSIRVRKTGTRRGRRKSQLDGFACATRASCRGERRVRLSSARDEAGIDRGRVDPDQLPLHSDVSRSVPAIVTVCGKERKGATAVHLPSDLRISWRLEPIGRGMVSGGSGRQSWFFIHLLDLEVSQRRIRGYGNHTYFQSSPLIAPSGGI